MSQPRRTPLYVAVHEAGHAVAMLATYPAPLVRYVSVIDQQPDRLGFCCADHRFDPSLVDGSYGDELRRKGREERAWMDVIDLLAGTVAELKFNKQSTIVRRLNARLLAASFANGMELERDSDFDLARGRLMWINPDNVQSSFVEAWDKTELLVQKHWKQIEELGRWLHHQGKIEFEELEDWWKHYHNLYDANDSDYHWVVQRESK